LILWFIENNGRLTRSLVIVEESSPRELIILSVKRRNERIGPIECMLIDVEEVQEISIHGLPQKGKAERPATRALVSLI
jgi:hypothetical protein